MKSLARLSFAAAALIAPQLVAPQLAHAQSPAPIGTWQGLNSGDYLSISSNGSCYARGTVNVAGTCTWQASSAGGILTMTYPWTIAPGHIYWNIIWVNKTTILVNSVERFVRWS
jgi:hypothetical protein